MAQKDNQNINANDNFEDSYIPKLIILTIKYQGDVFQVDMEEGFNAHDLKCRLASLLDLQESKQRLIFNGRVLKDQDILDALEDATIHVVRMAENQTLIASESMSSESSVQDKMMGQMMDHPMFKQLSMNEDFLKSMFLNNPQMKKLFEDNPELEHVLNDPSVLKDAMEMMRNPAYQREMMRNQDRAMSNIENLPEGFNALRRTYSSIQKPMFEALDETIQKKLESFPKDESQEENDINFKKSGHINTEPLPNPWTSKQRSNSSSYPQLSFFPTILDPHSNHDSLIAGSQLLHRATTESSRNTEASRRPRASSSSDQRSPEDRYQLELETLQQMGFSDREANLEALIQSTGNLQRAIEILIRRAS